MSADAINEDAPRRLALIRIVHSQAELGSMRQKVQDRVVERKGQAGWLDHVEQIDAFWQQLRQMILALDIDWHTTALYQDSLPMGPTAMAIVVDLAAHGSLNHKLLIELAERGARVEGTEDIALLIREVEALKAAEMSPEESADLIAQRDRFIAHRIDATLAAGETGFVFLGLIHDVRPYLPEDIEIIEDITQIG